MEQGIDIEITREALPGWKGKLQAINNVWVNIETAVLLVILTVMCLGAASQWLLRFCFKLGYPWISELNSYSLMWVGFLGACVAISRLQYFKIDLIRFIPSGSRNLRKIFRSIAFITAIIFCYILTIASWKYVTILKSNKEVSTYGMAIWPVYLIVVYFYATSMLRFFIMALLKIF